MPSLSQRSRDERLVIGITGRIGSGKTSVGQYLSSRYGFQYVRYSQVLAEWLANDTGSKVRLQEVGWEVMSGGMQIELNRRLVEQIRPQVDVAVDGLRHPIDYEHQRNSFLSSFHLLYIESPAELRWERLRGKYPSLQIFEAADSHPVEQQIESLRAKAILIIRNERSLDDLYAAVDEAIRGHMKDCE